MHPDTFGRLKGAPCSFGEDIFIYLSLNNKINKLWLCLYVADPATFLALNSVLRTWLSSEDSFFYSAMGKKKLYFWVCISINQTLSPNTGQTTRPSATTSLHCISGPAGTAITERRQRSLSWVAALPCSGASAVERPPDQCQDSRTTRHLPQKTQDSFVQTSPRPEIARLLFFSRARQCSFKSISCHGYTNQTWSCFTSSTRNSVQTYCKGFIDYISEHVLQNAFL